MKCRSKQPKIALLGGAVRPNPRSKTSEPRPHGHSTLTRLTAKPKAKMGGGPVGSGAYSSVVSKKPLVEMSSEIASITKRLGELGVNILPIVNASSVEDVVDYMESLSRASGTGKTQEQAMAFSEARELASEALSIIAPSRQRREPTPVSPRAASRRVPMPSAEPVRLTRKQRKAAADPQRARTSMVPDSAKISRSQRAIAAASRKPEDRSGDASYMKRVAMVMSDIERSKGAGVIAEITHGAFAGFSGPVSITGDGNAVVELSFMGKRHYVTVSEGHIRLSKVARDVDPSRERMHELVGKGVRVITGPLKNLRGDVVGERGSKLLVSFPQGVFEVRPKDIAEIHETKSNPGRYDIFTSSMRRA